jgi:hypothetical protein
MATGETRAARDLTIWFYAFGYFACYAPYSALTKALSKGLLPGMDGARVGNFELLVPTGLASLVAMLVFLSVMRWWKYASRHRVLGIEVPGPTRWTFLSGLCTTTIIPTTTLAYTFDGVSIVFVMLLMRGGVLILAPIVDAVSKRHVRWFSWAGLGLSLGALVVAFSESGGWEITLICAIDVAAYLAAYFVRLRFMSRLAKSEVPNANVRYFVEEQMVATPVLMILLGTFALIGGNAVFDEVRAGFTTFWSRPIVLETMLVGVLSQGTGVFGGLILLDRRENTYCVPVNRCSSVLAGVVAAYSLHFLLGQRAPSGYELVGAGMIIAAILVLTIAPQLQKRAAPAPVVVR